MVLSSERLTRSADGVIAGVCEGLGENLQISPNLLRLGWIIAVLFFGTGLVIYLALWWIMPREDKLPAKPVWGGTVLRRTEDDRKLFGVCGGLARRWDLDPTVVRMGVLALATLSFGLVGVAYLAAAVLIPGEHSSRPTYPVDL